VRLSYRQLGGNPRPLRVIQDLANQGIPPTVFSLESDISTII